MKIYLVRHGKTASNKLGAFNGIIDEPISDEGHNDLLIKRNIYKGLKFDYGYCSPLTRTVQTFEILFPDKKIDEMRADIVEMDFGDWSSQNIGDIVEHYLAQGYTLENFVEPPNGETYAQLAKRVAAFIDEVIQKHKDDEKIIVVSHGMVIGTIVDYLNFFKDKTAFELAPDNGLGYIIDIEDKKVKNIEKIKG